MVSIKTSYTKMLEMLGENISVDELGYLLAFAKSEIDDYVEEEDMLVLDIKTSNRPDLWCAEGMVREILGILGKAKKIPSYEVKPSDYKVVVDPELANTRPYIACAVAKNLNLTDYHIKQVMQLAEKIDTSYGRKRKRSSIGMYNLSMIKSPIEYKVIDPSHKFVPLGHEKEMTLPEILEKHEKGHEFGDIVKGYGHYPILLSADGLTLSLPPVINSNDVGKVTEETTECLIEVTGTNYETVNVILNILCQTLVEHGAKIYSVEINYPPKIKDGSEINPCLDIEEIDIDIDVLNKYLGTEITMKEAAELVEKRRFNCSSTNKSIMKVAIPPYRKDILHWVDIAEEIAIAMDLNKMGPTEWKVLTAGNLLPETDSENLVRDILLGLGGTELITFTLIDPDILTENVNLEDRKLVRIENPVSKSYSVLRDQIYPVLINVLSKNTHQMYPQTIYEVGEVARITPKTVITQTNAAFFHADADASFEDAHKWLDSFLKLLRTPYKIEKLEHPSFTEGRCGRIIINKKECGIIGEISPKVLEKNQIWVPVVGFEIELPLIPTLDNKIKETY